MPFPAPFGERWEHLTLTDVEAFLATAGEEALTWECKAGRARPEQVVRTAAGFANSELGGYLILGVDWVGGAWVLTGADLVPDVTAWLGTAVDRLAPRPHHDARTFTIEATGARIAVLAIEPVDVPPCLTTRRRCLRARGRTDRSGAGSGAPGDPVRPRRGGRA